MSKDLTPRSRKHIVETLVSDFLQADIDYLSIAEAINDECPGLEVSDDELALIKSAIQEEMSFAYDLWVAEQ